VEVDWDKGEIRLAVRDVDGTPQRATAVDLASLRPRSR